MADEPISGTSMLVTGADPATADPIVAALEAAGATSVVLEPDPGAAVEHALAQPPDAVVVLGGPNDAVRRALHPFGAAAGPPVVDIDDALVGTPAAAVVVVDLVSTAVEKRRLLDHVAQLEATVVETTVQQSLQLHRAREDTLLRLGRIAEYRDDNSWEHTERVAQLAARLAARIGVSRATIEFVRRAAPLHDIGKIAIPDAILLKPGKLTEYEFEVVKTHTVVGAHVLGGGTSDLMRTAEQVVRSHHERWDGSGYPDGLAGEDIPLVARFVQVADVFDILTHERPHKEAWTLDDAAAEIARGAGTQFDPAVVQAFTDLGPEVWRAPAPLRERGG